MPLSYSEFAWRMGFLLLIIISIIIYLVIEHKKNKLIGEKELR